MEDENGERTQDDELVQFLLKPNNHQNFKEFAKEFIRNLYASGYAYLLPTSENPSYTRRLDKLGASNRPELLVLNTDCIEYQGTYLWGIIDKRNKFKYSKNDSHREMEFDSIIPFYDKAQDPDNYRIGVSRLCALKDEINNIVLANRAKTNKIKQSGKFLVTPSTKSLQNGFGNQLDQPVDVKNPSFKQKDLLEQQLEYSGLSQDKSITVAKVEMQTHNVMESIQNYSYDDEVKEDKRTIKNTFGIPRELQNIGDDKAKYENRKEAFLELFTLNVLPLSVNFTESLQQYYAPKDSKKLILDYSHHPAFEIVKDKQALKKETQTDTVISLFREGLIDNKRAIEILETNEII